MFVLPVSFPSVYLHEEQPNIVEYLGLASAGFETMEIYMPVKDGNILQLFQRFPNVRSDYNVCQTLVKEMLSALDYLAFRGYIHRDVKPSNILFKTISKDACHFQLADFGLANRTDLAQAQCGTDLYMAPEMRNRGTQSPKLDVWSLFVTFIEVLELGEFNMRQIDSYDQLRSRVAFAAAHPSVGFLKYMARENPDLRASAAQMLDKFLGGMD